MTYTPGLLSVIMPLYNTGEPFIACMDSLIAQTWKAPGGNMNNSQFWTWVDYWECWDFMQDELEDELELEDWADEALWLICLRCGNPLEGCVC